VDVAHAEDLGPDNEYILSPEGDDSRVALGACGHIHSKMGCFEVEDNVLTPTKDVDVEGITLAATEGLDLSCGKRKS
jgi:hypothetical protein